MKEEKILESMFEQARKEKPKRSYKVVATAFLSTSAATAFGGIKSLLSNNIYLNSFIGLTLSVAISSTVYITEENNHFVAQDTVIEQITMEHAEPNLVEIPLLLEIVNEVNIQPLLLDLEAKFMDDKQEYSSYEIIDDEFLAYRGSPRLTEEIDGSNALNSALVFRIKEEDQNALNTEETTSSKSASLIIGEDLENDIESKDDEIEDSEETFVIPIPSKQGIVQKTAYSMHPEESAEDDDTPIYGLEERQDLTVRYAIHSADDNDKLNDFSKDLNNNGINTTMKWSYNFSKDKVKKVVLELCDAEGYVQKVVATNFDLIEIFWSVDDNGFPYNVFIIWDGNHNQRYEIDLKDEKFPTHKYKG